jgi:hypothetical protein
MVERGMGDRGVARGPGGPPHQRPVAERISGAWFDILIATRNLMEARRLKGIVPPFSDRNER